MTAHEFFDLWPLWTYLFGFVTTFMGIVAKGAYHDVDVADVEYVFPALGVSFVWPLTILYYGGKGAGVYLRSRKERLVIAKREQKKLEEKHAKLLKEAGL